MRNSSSQRAGTVAANLIVVSFEMMFLAPQASATDYFLTIGGGYSRTGNQASLEANVQFFQQILAEKHHGPRRHGIFFADGDDPGFDLQIVAEGVARTDAPATDLLASLHRRRGQTHVTYRNHGVEGIAGPLDPALIRADLDGLAKTAGRGDRLIVYVTAHGSEGKEDDEYDTTIDCWNNRKITAREFGGWLGKFSADVPVVMVMAQCYCGGFAHAIFERLDEAKGLTPQLRIGFFAQQHDLPAAGCRPDIEHDEEFSSYFWGAIVGRSRNGKGIEGCDLDGNGAVSFAEAHAYAVIAGETVDIPLKASDVLLRTYSDLGDNKSDAAARRAESKTKSGEDVDPKATPDEARHSDKPATVSGTLQSFIDGSRPAAARVVAELSKTLGFTPQQDVEAVLAAEDELRREGRFTRRRGGRRRMSGRREFLKEVGDKWPELADPRHWEESPLLKPENQERLFAELKALPGWASYQERPKETENADDRSDQHELRTVKFRRLIDALETIVLERNLPLFAKPEIVERYRRMLALEDSTLDGAGK